MQRAHYLRSVATLVVVLVFSRIQPVLGNTRMAYTTISETRTGIEQPMHENKLLLASHGGTTASLGAVDILGTQPESGSTGAISNSIWGNMILQMAYARDKELSRSAKKLKITDNLTLASIYGISGVSLAQSIASVAVIDNSNKGSIQLPGTSTERAEEGIKGANSESEKESYAPGVLGIIASGSTLLALGLRFYYGRRYSKQIKQRQRALKAKVEIILDRLEKGESPESLRSELISLIGERATKEFSQLWKSSHLVAAGGASS